jgi:UDP-N-acetylmuramate--alanine ligase
MADKALVINGDDQNTLKAVEDIKHIPIITFGYNENNDYCVKNVTFNGYGHNYDLYYKGEFLLNVKLSVPGIHNVLNSAAATAAAVLAGTPIGEIEKAIPHFNGAGRRFERLGTVNGFTVVDDYAHHPKEIEVTLKSAKQLNFNKIWAVFQPFTYSRTYLLLDDFAKALSIADNVVLSEIMGSREKNTYNIYSKDLAEKTDNCVWYNTFEEMADHIIKNAKAGDLVITLGCGDVYKCAKMILQKGDTKNG